MTHVLNPKTNRMIKVGGKPWRQLVRQGMLPNNPTVINPDGSKIPNVKQREDNLLYEADSVDSANQAREEIMAESERKKAVNKLAPNQHPARKGKKIVKVTNAPKHVDLAKYTAQCASRTLHKHINDLSDQLEYAYSNSSDLDATQLKEFEESLKELILQEMISGDANLAPTVKTMKKKAVNETDYEVESLQGDDEYTDEEYTDEEYEDEEKYEEEEEVETKK